MPPDATPLASAWPAAPIEHDLACAGCGYNLRGLTEDRKCPECGKDVSASVWAQQQVRNNPSYLRKLRLGAVFLLAALLQLRVAQALVEQYWVRRIMLDTGIWVDALLRIGATCIYQALLLVCVWLVTLTLPALGGESKRDKQLRRTGRCFAIVHALFAIPFWLALHLGYVPNSTLESSLLWIVIVLHLIVMAVVVAVLARRARDLGDHLLSRYFCGAMVLLALEHAKYFVDWVCWNYFGVGLPDDLQPLLLQARQWWTCIALTCFILLVTRTLRLAMGMRGAMPAPPPPTNGSQEPTRFHRPWVHAIRCGALGLALGAFVFSLLKQSSLDPIPLDYSVGEIEGIVNIALAMSAWALIAGGSFLITGSARAHPEAQSDFNVPRLIARIAGSVGLIDLLILFSTRDAIEVDAGNMVRPVGIVALLIAGIALAWHLRNVAAILGRPGLARAMVGWVLGYLALYLIAIFNLGEWWSLHDPLGAAYCGATVVCGFAATVLLCELAAPLFVGYSAERSASRRG